MPIPRSRSRGAAGLARCRLLSLALVLGCWVIFNMFIGLVKRGAMADALTRSLLDVVSMAIAMGLAESVGRRRAA